MRVSTGYQFESYGSSIQRAMSRMVRDQDMVMTGKRITRPSDDPFGVSQTMTMRALDSALNQFQANLNIGKGFLGFTEEALGSIHSLARRGYELAINGASDSATTESRRAMADEVVALQRRLVDLGNARGAQGQYLFAGTLTNTQPFQATPPTLAYAGDAGAVRIEVAPGQTMQVNMNASGAITDLYTRLESLKNNLISGNAGAVSGVDIGALQATMNEFLGMRGEVGARMRTVADLEASHDRRREELTARISDVEDVDMTEAVVSLKQSEAAYQAALQVASQGFRLSLMDFIR